MAKNLLYRSCHLKTEFSLFPSTQKIIFINIILLFLFFQGCGLFTSRQITQRYFSQTDIENIVQNLKEQEDIVTEFIIPNGKLSISGRVLGTSLHIDAFGRKNPFMLKMEISHSLGKPLYYFLIKENSLEIRDFSEKKQYTGKITPDNLSKFLPGMDCSPDMVWSFLRGYPHFSSYARVYEAEPGVLTLKDRRGKSMGTITFSPDLGIKEAVSAPPRFPKMEFTGFQKTGEIDYAEKTVVEMEDIKGKKDMMLKRNKVIFTKDIPDAIFTLENRPVYEVVNLDDLTVLQE